MPQPQRHSNSSALSASHGPHAEEIVDVAVALAEEVGWANVRLRRVAERVGVPLSEVLVHFRDLDGVADAWFGRALAAMVAAPESGFAKLPARERVYLVLMRWFDANVGHRRVTGEMVRSKLYPSHPHHWVPMIFSLSRLIQWVRETALLDAGGLRRQVEEVGLTDLFLATLAVWLADRSDGQERTRRFLRGRLAEADRILSFAPGERRTRLPPVQ
jgi:AcrR family transcriptional regulator